ncbi:hypothetical protein TOPH_06229 [Tolypocladium ophioglossoides CBS 100239]|uniref:Uncharacterized protein n=1 Tax=Tolypocladium ophioglossoides (strain CBS 100239) TaxID=1163406 RepID=A0A0L0N5W0_TOLOC|nr:hypothetical protein TOPH_06229 [Tolypocladium ophioglossoides CBS 100239]
MCKEFSMSAPRTATALQTQTSRDSSDRPRRSRESPPFPVAPRVKAFRSSVTLSTDDALEIITWGLAFPERMPPTSSRWSCLYTQAMRPSSTTTDDSLLSFNESSTRKHAAVPSSRTAAIHRPFRTDSDR